MDANQLLTDTLDPSTADAQSQSPLFQLPGEVRTRIFSFALLAYADRARPYEPGSFHYRPGLEGPPRVAVQLLRTCRRAYLEVGLLASAQVARPYWWGRPPPDRPACRNPITDLQRLAPPQRAVAAVRIFAQQYLLEGALRSGVLAHPLFRPARLILCLRHGDWWHWEHGAPLALDAQARDRPRAGRPAAAPDDAFHPSSWGAAVGDIGSLRTFELELETVRAKQQELDAIVARAKGWVFASADPATRAVEGRLVCDAAATRTSSWEGIDRFYELEGRTPAADEGKEYTKLEYYVVNMLWKRKATEATLSSA